MKSMELSLTHRWLLMLTVILPSTPVYAVCNLDPVQAIGEHNGPSAVAVSPDNQNVYLTSFAADLVAVYRRNGSGCGLTFVESREDGDFEFARDSGIVNGLDGASAVAVSPDGNNVYVTGAADNALAVFHRDAANDGELAFLEVHVNALNLPANVLKKPQAIAVSSDGSNVYVGAKESNTLVVFQRFADGTLQLLEHFRQGNGVDGLKNPSGVAVTGDGFNVYVSASSLKGTVAVFKRDPNDDGRLTFASFLTKSLIPGLVGASAVSISPDDAHVYVTGLTADSLVVLARNLDDPPAHPSYGALSHVQTKIADASTPLRDPSSVVVSRSDGRHVYVTSGQDDALLAFARDENDGTLQLVETRFDGTVGVPNLQKPVSGVLSMDDCVYVASEKDDGLMVFDRFAPTTTICDMSPNQCTSRHCDAGLCVEDPLPDTAPCTDSNPCTGPDHCDGAGDCSGAFLPATTPCSDFNPCTTTEMCDGAGVCVGSCDVGLPCPFPCFGVNSICDVLAESVCGCTSDW